MASKFTVGSGFTQTFGTRHLIAIHCHSDPPLLKLKFVLHFQEIHNNEHGYNKYYYYMVVKLIFSYIVKNKNSLW